MALNPAVAVVVPGELITAAHLNAVRANLDRLDVDKFAKAGGTLTGGVVLAGPTGTGVINNSPSGSFVASDSAARIIVGKSALDIIQAGVQIHGSGSIWLTTNTQPDAAVQIQHGLAGSINGAPYQYFRTQNQGVIGSITQVGTTGVAYNTTSDERMKADDGDVELGDVEASLMALKVHRFTWRDDPAAGDQVGLYAQEAAAVVPDAVSAGVGAPGDEDFVPWGIDYGRLVPRLLAHVQALTARVAELEAAR